MPSLLPMLLLKACPRTIPISSTVWRSEEHTSELQSRGHLVCRLLLEKKKQSCCAKPDPLCSAKSRNYTCNAVLQQQAKAEQRRLNQVPKKYKQSTMISSNYTQQKTHI